MVVVEMHYVDDDDGTYCGTLLSLCIFKIQLNARAMQGQDLKVMDDMIGSQTDMIDTGYITEQSIHTDS